MKRIPLRRRSQGETYFPLSFSSSSNIFFQHWRWFSSLLGRRCSAISFIRLSGIGSLPSHSQSLILKQFIFEVFKFHFNNDRKRNRMRWNFFSLLLLLLLPVQEFVGLSVFLAVEAFPPQVAFVNRIPYTRMNRSYSPSPPPKKKEEDSNNMCLILLNDHDIIFLFFFFLNFAKLLPSTAIQFPCPLALPSDRNILNGTLRRSGRPKAFQLHLSWMAKKDRNV